MLNLILIKVAQANTNDDSFGYYMMSNYGFMGMGGGFMGGLFMLLFWLLVIIGIVYLIKYFSKNQSSEQHKSPLDILKERYARGEIDKAEFEKKKKDLI
jgi:putative membrane protein